MYLLLSLLKYLVKNFQISFKTIKRKIMTIMQLTIKQHMKQHLHLMKCTTLSAFKIFPYFLLLFTACLQKFLYRKVRGRLLYLVLWSYRSSTDVTWKQNLKVPIVQTGIFWKLSNQESLPQQCYNLVLLANGANQASFLYLIICTNKANLANCSTCIILLHWLWKVCFRWQVS